MKQTGSREQVGKKAKATKGAVRVLAQPGGRGHSALVLVRDGRGVAKHYTVAALAALAPPWRRFAVTEFGKDGYTLDVDAEEGSYHCDCPGARHAKRCKHGRALLALIRRQYF